ncbi:MAG: c-type cytochrome [Anaerolineae bacterium]
MFKDNPTLRNGIIVGAVGVVVLLVIATTVLVRTSPLNRTYSVSVQTVPIPTDAESLARGEYLVRAVGACMVCHGDDLSGRLAFEDAFLGEVYTPNLTTGEGGVGQTYTTEDWVRSIRHGIGPDGKGLIFMPVDSYYHLTDEDLGAMIAFLQSVPPVDNTNAARRLTLPAQILLTLGASGQVARTELIPHEAPRPSAPEDPGEYLTDIGGCHFCHGPELAGGQGLEPGAPPGSDLTVGGVLDDYTLDDFRLAMRSGIKLDGTIIDPIYMPWAGYTHMTDEDVTAIWDYLRSLD